MEKSDPRLSPRSIFVGVIVFVLVIGGLATGSYYIYKNSIQANPSTANAVCKITVTSFNPSFGLHGQNLYLLNETDLNKLKANPSKTPQELGLSDALRGTVPLNSPYTIDLSYYGPNLYLVGKQQADASTPIKVVNSNSFKCSSTVDTFFNATADLSQGNIVVTQAAVQPTGQAPAGQTSLTQGSRTAKITVTVKDQSGQIIPEGVEVYFNPKDASGNAQQAQHCTTMAQANGSCSANVFFTRGGTVLIKAVRGPESASQSLSYDTDDPVDKTVTLTLGTTAREGETKDLNFLVVSDKGAPVYYAQVLATIGSIGTDYKKKIVYENTCNTPANSGQCTIKGVPRPSTTQTITLEVMAAKAGRSARQSYSGWENIPSNITITITGLLDADAKKYEPPTPAGVTPFKVPVIGNGLPVGNSSVTFQAVRASLASESQVTPVGGVKYTLDIKVPQTFIDSQKNQEATATASVQPGGQSSGYSEKVCVVFNYKGETIYVNYLQDGDKYYKTERHDNTAIPASVPVNQIGNFNTGDDSVQFLSTRDGICTTTSSLNSDRVSLISRLFSAIKNKDFVSPAFAQTTGTIPITDVGGNIPGGVSRSKSSSQFQGRTYTISGNIPDNGIKSRLRLDKLPPGEYALTLSKDAYNSSKYYFTISTDGSQLDLGGLPLEPEQRYRYLLLFSQNRDIEPPSIGSSNIYFWYGVGGKENEYRTPSSKINNLILRYLSRKARCGWQNTSQTYREDCSLE